MFGAYASRQMKVTAANGASGQVCVPDPYWANVTVQLHCDGTNLSTTVPDTCLVPNTFTCNGNAKLSTTQAKFGSTSALFDGSGDFLRAPHATGLDIPTGDFCVECWVWLSALAGSVILTKATGTGVYPYQLWYDNLSGKFGFRACDNTSVLVSILGTTTALTGRWYHIAGVRSGTTYTLYVSGVAEATTINATTPMRSNASDPLVIGAYTDGTFCVNGFIDEVRITKGAARYTTNFTPGTVANCDGLNAINIVGSPVPPGPGLAFSASARASLFGVTGSAVGTVTLATITCSDATMTIRTSETVPGLTFAYASNVLTISGTPTTPTGLHRVTVTYVASDGVTIRGSTTHEITIVSATEVLTIGSMAGASGKVGIPMNATLAVPSANFVRQVNAVVSGSVPGVTVTLAWPATPAGASAPITGPLVLSGTPTLDGTFPLSVTYYSNGVSLGTSTHSVVIGAAYVAPPPAPAPAPGPTPPAPSPPPVPSPAPQPGYATDPYYSSVKVLMHCDNQRGQTYNAKDGSSFIPTATIYGAAGAVAEGLRLTYDNFYHRPPGVGGILAAPSGLDSATLTAECMVDIDATAWAALTASGSDTRFSPVLSCWDRTGALLWTLGFGSWIVSGPTRLVGPVFYNGTGYAGFGLGSVPGQAIPFRPGRFIHLAGSRSPASAGNTNLTLWADGLGGSTYTVSTSSLLTSTNNGVVAPAQFIVGGAQPSMPVGLPGGAVTFVPFSGVVDEVRVTAASRYLAFVNSPTSLTLPVQSRVIPWPDA
jgi:hypothetical protein